MIITTATSFGEPIKFIYRAPQSYPRCEMLHTAGETRNRADPKKASRLVAAITLFSTNHFFYDEGAKSFFRNNEFHFLRNSQLVELLKRNTPMRKHIRYICFTDHICKKASKELYPLLQNAEEIREIWFMSRIGHQAYFHGIGYSSSFNPGSFAASLFRDAYPLLAAQATPESRCKVVGLFKFHPQLGSFDAISQGPRGGKRPSEAKPAGQENQEFKIAFSKMVETRWEEVETEFQEDQKLLQRRAAKRAKRAAKAARKSTEAKCNTHSSSIRFRDPSGVVSNLPQVHTTSSSVGMNRSSFDNALVHNGASSNPTFSANVHSTADNDRNSSGNTGTFNVMRDNHADWDGSAPDEDMSFSFGSPSGSGTHDTFGLLHGPLMPWEHLTNTSVDMDIFDDIIQYVN